jgi:hypothetical protein
MLASWGIKMGQQAISDLEKCAVIGFGSVGVDMVHVDGASQASTVVTNALGFFLEMSKPRWREGRNHNAGGNREIPKYGYFSQLRRHNEGIRSLGQKG